MTETQSDSVKPVNKTVSIIIPTFNNYNQLLGCVNSIHEQSSHTYQVIVVNNGEAGTTDKIKALFEGGPQIDVVDCGGKNLGWEGGLIRGLKESKTPYVCFMNDDTLVVPGTGDWMEKMLQSFGESSVSAVGPTSNMVMGAQGFLNYHAPKRFVVKLLIGFCMVVRRKALDAVGGITLGLPGGDDFDMSLRFNKAGHKMIFDARVFVYHFGCQTGNRVRNDWNSERMQRDTRNEMIRRHGLSAFIEMSAAPPVEWNG